MATKKANVGAPEEQELCPVCKVEMLVHLPGDYRQPNHYAGSEQLIYTEAACNTCRTVRPIYVRASEWEALLERIQRRAHMAGT